MFERLMEVYGMANPVLIELTRGQLVESYHRGAYAVTDGTGKIVFSDGDVEQPIFPRSAVKVMQALYLVESGAAEAYALSNQELALSCSSHSGEQAHAELAQKMLAKAGLGIDNLECGSHWSFDHNTLIGQAKSGLEPTQFHNNCSGKHAGFLCAACHSGLDPKGYIHREHEVQRQVAANMQALTGAKLTNENCGTDGCSIPTYAIGLKNIAHGFAKMTTGEGLSSTRHHASTRLINACMQEPFYVAGTGRACTKIMEMAPGRIFVKTGAEGVFCALLPELGLGLALKIDDGATRAAEAAIAGLLAKCLGKDDPATHKLLEFANRPFKNWNKITEGRFNVAPSLSH